MPAHAGEFKTPMDCTKERKQDGSITDLDRLQHIQPMLRSLRIQVICLPSAHRSRKQVIPFDAVAPLRAALVWVAALISHVSSKVATDAAAYGITPATPAKRAGAGAPPNNSENFLCQSISTLRALGKYKIGLQFT